MKRSIRRTTRARAKITTTVIPVGEHLTIEVDVFTPERLAQDAVAFYCVGGGNVNRGYFDLGGQNGGERSFARSMAARGHVVVTIDPIGVGGSSIPVDGFALTIQDEARWIAAAVTELRTRRIEEVELGTLFAVGIGHSAGGMMIGATQGLHASFDAAVLMGFGPAGLGSFLPEEVQERLRQGAAPGEVAPDLARALFGGSDYFEAAPDPDTDDGRLLATIRCPYPATLGALAIVPGNIVPELLAITAPVFIGISSEDLIEDAHEIGAAIPGTKDFTLFIVPEATHEIFLSPRIGELYERLSLWLPAARLSARLQSHETSDSPPVGRYDLATTKVAALVDDPEAAAIIEVHIPGMTTHKMIKMAKSTTITRILPLTGVDAAVQQALLAELSALPPR